MNRNIWMWIITYCIVIFSFLFIVFDRNILYCIYLLLSSEKMFVFLKIGYEMEHGTRFSDLYTYIIRILIIMYILLFPIFNFVYVAITGYKYNYPIYKQYYEICTNPFLIPHLECSITNGIYSANHDIELFIKMQNKLFWNDLFIQHNIKTPLIIGTIINNRSVLNTNLDPNKKYILKPIVGGFGKNIVDYNGSTPITNHNIDYIIQEKIVQSIIKGHFRINTVFDKTQQTYQLLNIYLCLNAKDKIASNCHNGGKCNEVSLQNDTIRNALNHDTVKLSNHFKRHIIDQIVNDALKLHRTLPESVISVGFDVMIEGDNYYFLEGNVPHGTVLPDDIYFYEKSVNIHKLFMRNTIFHQ